MPNKTPTKTTTTKGPFRWTRERRAVMELLHTFYIARVNDLLAIRGDESDDVRRNVQYILARLQERGYVGRLQFFDNVSDSRATVYAYFLTDKGARELEDPAAAFSKESEIIPRHEIEITQFHIRLYQWAQKRGLILHWHRPKMNHTKSINPDARFSIEEPNLPQGKNTTHYFLEIERSPLGNYRDGEPSIVRKLTKYYEYFNTDACEKDWRFRKFRVITVVRTADKMYNLCKLMSDKFSHRMFWMTTEPLFKDNIGGEVFRTPKDFSKSGYSFLSQ
jgi:hypothetical protein